MHVPADLPEQWGVTQHAGRRKWLVYVGYLPLFFPRTSTAGLVSSKVFGMFP